MPVNAANRPGWCSVLTQHGTKGNDRSASLHRVTRCQALSGLMFASALKRSYRNALHSQQQSTLLFTSHQALGKQL